MAVFTPTDTFDNVYQLDTSDPVKGGPVSGPVDAPTDGQANAQAKALANRTLWLLNRLSPVGEITAFGGSSAPTGWLLCNGSAVSRATYSSLFSVIGTNYGQGNGTTTFNIPDLRGRFLRGVDGGSGVDPDAGSRTAMATGGNTGNNVGSIQDDAFESHSHNVNILTGGGSIGSGTIQHEVQDSSPGAISTSSSGGNETRPKNAYVNYIIRADY